MLSSTGKNPPNKLPTLLDHFLLHKWAAFNSTPFLKQPTEETHMSRNQSLHLNIL